MGNTLTAVVNSVWGKLTEAPKDVRGVLDAISMNIDNTPVDIGQPSPCDLYVGLHPGGQTEGKTKLVSAIECGNSGTVDIGLRGSTPTDPADPNFLGLPVTYDAIFIPHDMDPIPANVVYRQDGMQAVFQGDTMSPSGQYRALVPEPATVSLLALLALGLPKRAASKWGGQMPMARR